jgi:hypothetical protein
MLPLGLAPGFRLAPAPRRAHQSVHQSIAHLLDSWQPSLRDRAFFAREVAAWTEGQRSVNEVGIGLLQHWLAPAEPPATITHSEVLGVVPLEVTDALLDTLRTVAARHERGFMVEHLMELLASASPEAGCGSSTTGPDLPGNRHLVSPICSPARDPCAAAARPPACWAVVWCCNA